MNIGQFKTQISESGLARNSRWVCSVFPPKQLSSAMNTISKNLGGGVTLNLPGIDLSNIPLAEIATAQSGLPNISSSLNLPALGFNVLNGGTALQKLNLYCNMVTLPERDIRNVEWREHGESRQLGIVHNHSKGVSLSYYCSENLTERFFFEQWQDIIFNHQNKKRAYYDDYISSVEITKYDAGWNKPMSIYKLHEAYPTNVAAQTLNYEGTALMRLDINMKYRYYERLK